MHRLYGSKGVKIIGAFGKFTGLGTNPDMTTAPDKRRRLDVAVVDRGLAPSRARALDLIRRGLVSIDGRVESKAGTLVAATAVLTVAFGVDADRVSRGGEKLEAGLAAFGFDPAGRLCLDVGASTGGFTESLLRLGASRVIAVDVGRGQLHPRLAGDPRVVSFEGRDARSLTAVEIPQPVGAIVADVSFISLRLALAAPLTFAAQGCWVVALVKPQFEAGRAAVGKGGVVRHEEDRERAVREVREWLGAIAGWRIAGVVPSPITGGSGNVEFLLGAVRDA